MRLGRLLLLVAIVAIVGIGAIFLVNIEGDMRIIAVKEFKVVEK